jgi:diguanylate cyclase (GGDEF)-like protein/PAS domain S-box-containing protein
VLTRPAPADQRETTDPRTAHRKRIARRSLWDRSVSSILIAGACISLVSFVAVHREENRSALDEFKAAAASSEYQVGRHIEAALGTLRALQAYASITPNVSSTDLQRFGKELSLNTPGQPSLEWSPRGAKLPVTETVASRTVVPLYLPVATKQVRGYVVGWFQADELLGSGLTLRSPDSIDVQFFDGDAEFGKQFLYQNQGPSHSVVARYKSAADALQQAPFKEIVRLEVGGRHWAMVMTATDAYKKKATSWISWTLLATLLVIAALAAAHLVINVSRARSDEEKLHLQLRKATEDALRISEERYALAARGSKDGLWDWDLEAGLIFYSDRWKSMLGLDVHAVGNSPAEWLDRLYPADRARVESEIADHCGGKTKYFQSEYRILHNDGSYHWMLSRGVAVINKKGAATRLAGSQTDITESKAADPLTGLASRLLLDEKLQFAIDEMRTHAERQFSVLFLDLDRFKMVNDSLGHLAGDQLLLQIAHRLLAAVAEPPFGQLKTLVARLGGDEFVILIGGMSQPELAITLANRIQDRIAPAFNLDGRQLFVSISIGVRFGQTEGTPEALLLDADTAMYHAKSRGKQRCEVFVPAMRLEAVERLRLETDLRTAIEGDELAVYYQPKVCMATGRLIELEALVRWRHPQRGVVGPMEFIPLAEDTGLIIQLGECVLRKSCLQMKAWLSEYDLDPEVRVSVNLSCRQFREPNLFDRIVGILEETGLPPERLSLEVTEGVLMENVDAAIVLLNRLRAHQIGLELDDFGTGYSSLSYLRRLPFDGLKIDKSFVNEIGLRQENAEIVGMIALLAHSLGMKVLAEGVETLEQLRMLIDLGCDYAQGHLFSAPVDSEAASEFFSGFAKIIGEAELNADRAVSASV